jgi:uncharacterized protein (DUF58 family)
VKISWYPQPRLLLLVVALIGVSCLTLITDDFYVAWKTSAIFLAGLGLYDWWQTRNLPTPRVKRIMPSNLPMSASSAIHLQIKHVGTQPLKLIIHDHHPQHFEVTKLPQRQRIEPQQTIEIEYRVTPPRRGDAEFSGTEVLLRSPFGLWINSRIIDNTQTVRVYPNFAEMTRYALLATDNRLSRIGIKQRQRRGQGNEFLQLREYRAGDSQRQIHWQASAKYRKLITKEYQDEKDQQVIFLLDCGQRMRHQDQQRAHLDQALNAVLLLAYVAVRQGDAVGMMTLGEDNRWLAPRKGQKRVNHLLTTLYDLESTSLPADYLAAAIQLDKVQQRRALVVLITNTRNEDHQQLMRTVKQLQRRHLVVLADLREEILEETLHQPIEDIDEALQYSAIQQYLAAREQYHRRLQHQNIATLNVTAKQLPSALVNQYLQIKASSKL